MGRIKTTGSGSQVFTKQLLIALRETLRDTSGRYDCAAWFGSFREDAKQLLRAIAAPERLWHDTQVFARAYVDGDLGKLTKQFRIRPLVVVGPLRMANLKKHPSTYISFGHARYIMTAEKNCFSEVDRIAGQIAHNIAQDAVVVLCCGPTAKVLIHRLARPDITMIDLGSALDPFVGVFQRKYHRKRDPDSIEL